MAERDRFEKGFGAGWLGAFRWARDGTAPIEEIADRLVKTLAKDLRTQNGIPRLGDFLTIIENSSPATFLDCFDALERIVRAESGHRHVKIAAEVGKALLVQMPAHPPKAATDISAQFTEEVCRAIIENRFFGKAGVPLRVEGKFSNYNESRQWQERLEQLMQPDLKKIADRLILQPDADGLRAPPRRGLKKTTSELLNENLLAD